LSWAFVDVQRWPLFSPAARLKGVLEEGALGIKQLQRLAGLWIVQHLLNEGGGIALPSSAAF